MEEKKKIVHPTLSLIVDANQKTKYIRKNKEDLHEREMQKKYLKTHKVTQKEYKKQRLLEKMEEIKKKNKGIIGVDEGIIKLPEVSLTRNWIKLTKEEIELKKSELECRVVEQTTEATGINEMFIESEEEKKQEDFFRAKEAINEIKKLNNWDIQHAQRNVLRRRSANFSNLTQGLNSYSLKWMLEMKNNQKEMELLNRNKNLKDFFNKIDLEQKAIFNQNMNVNKKQFHFDVFENNIHSHHERESESNMDAYKEIMKEKLKVEEFLRIDLSNIAEQVFQKKTQKKKLLEEISKLLLDINALNQEKKKVIDQNNLECKRIMANPVEKRNGRDFLFINKKTKAIKETKSQKLIKKQQTMEIINETNRRVAELKKEKEAIEVEILNKNRKMEEIEEELRKLKLRITDRVSEHKKYYFEILKKGIDVRAEGLSWVIVRLIELKAFIENSKFPKFLNSEQVEYLLRFSYKKYELSELIKLFQVLKKQQKSLREQFIVEQKSNELTKLKQNFQENKIVLEEDDNPAIISIHDKLHKYFEEIALKYENVIHVSLNESKEEKYVGSIVKDLRNKIMVNNFYDSNNDFDGLYFLPGSLAEFFNENKKYRQYFDDILYLNREINVREKELAMLKKEALIKFKSKNEMKSRAINSVENEMVFSALFGNGIIV